MSKAFDPKPLADALRAGLVPPSATREDRVRMSIEVRDLLFKTGTPAALFWAGAISAWLIQGGDLARDHLKITPPRGSRLTVDALYRRLISDEDGEDDLD